MARPVDVAMLQQIISSLFESYPELKDDEDLRLDMLHGTTNFVETVDAILRQVQDVEALAGAADTAIKDIKKRKDRFDRRSEFGRELIKQLMEAADIRKIELATGTVSVINKSPSVVIVDEASLPSDFLRVKMEPNKTAIKEALNSGVTVAGAAMSNGGTSLMIRR